MTWLRRIRAAIRRALNPPGREIVFVSWDKAERMLAANDGWRLAKEEDFNQVLGMVFLERDAP